MKEGRLAERVSIKAAISIAAMLEFLAAEVLEISCENLTMENKRRTIQPRHISLGLKGDEELARLVGDRVTIPSGGVIPYIHPELEVKQKMSRKRLKQLRKEHSLN